jgi:GxxExxY protein
MSVTPKFRIPHAGHVFVELKSVEFVLPVHHAQVLSYLRHTKKPLGLLMNFNVAVLADGVERIKNGY